MTVKALSTHNVFDAHVTHEQEYGVFSIRETFVIGNGQAKYGGVLSIASSLGNFNQRWHNTGTDFRKFLCSMDKDYFFSRCSDEANKGREFDYALGVKAARDSADAFFIDGTLTAREHEAIRMQLGLGLSLVSRDSFFAHISSITEAYPKWSVEPALFYVERYSKNSNVFWDSMWGQYVSYLKGSIDVRTEVFA